MTVSVPTADEFAALEARVAALEAGGSTPPPDPPDPITEEVQAKRIADLVGAFGVNTFSSLDDSNLWGAWPSNYSPPSVIAALRFMLGDSGHTFRIREYHYSGREQMQQQWLSEVTAAIPGTQATVCVGANGAPDDVPTMLGLAADPACNVRWCEGLNEPNTAFFGPGSEVPVETTLAIQQAVAKEPGGCRVLGPSIVAGTPHPEGWITGYCGDQMGAINEALQWGNGHYYPPHAPDVPNTGYSVNEYVGGLWTAYAAAPIALTEFHPTLYAAGTLAIKQRMAFLAGRGRRDAEIPAFRANASRDPFYTLTTLLRCGKNGTMGLWWYALYDYGTTYECGLFPKDYANDPRPTAIALQSLCTICADRGDRLGFAPGKLDVEVSGLTPAMDFDVYQASDGRFLLPIWYAAEDADQGDMVQVTVRFGAAKSAVSIYDPLHGTAVIDRLTNVDAAVLDVRPGVTILEVRL